MARDWGAVAEAMKSRLAELDMTQAELIQRSRLAPMTIRDLPVNPPLCLGERHPQVGYGRSRAPHIADVPAVVVRGYPPRFTRRRGHRNRPLLRLGALARSCAHRGGGHRGQGPPTISRAAPP